jgi:hypothetical protein
VPEPEPIELPWPVFEAMSKSKTFFDLLEGWDQFGPAHTKSLRAQDALALIGKILPHIPKPRLGYGQHFQNLCYDLGEGWVLEVCLSDHRGTRTVIGHEFSTSARLWVPPWPGQKGTYVSRGMVYATPWGLEDVRE